MLHVLFFFDHLHALKDVTQNSNLHALGIFCNFEDRTDFIIAVNTGELGIFNSLFIRSFCS